MKTNEWRIASTAAPLRSRGRDPPTTGATVRCACSSTADMWFPEKGASPAAAKLLCGRCEVRGECLEFALDTHEEFGIWGGLSTAERRALRRRRRLRRALDRAGVDLPFELDEPGCGLSVPDGEAA